MHQPKGWTAVMLGEIAEIGSGVTLGRNVTGGGSIELPYLRVANVQDGRLDLTDIKTVRVFKHELGRYQLQPGDVLMTEGGDFDKLGRGSVWRAEITPCLHQNHIFRVRTDRRVLLPEFLAAVCASDVGKRYFVQSSKQTTNLASINSTQLKAFRVPCPPIAEQRRIADILDAADDAIRQTERLIAKLRQVKAGLLHDLLTRGIDEQGRLRDPGTQPELFKVSEGENIPKGWSHHRLQDIGEWKSGGTPSKEVPRFWNGTIPWVSAKDMKSPVLEDAQDHITQDAVHAGAKLLSPGSILILVRGMTLAHSFPVCLVACQMAFNQDIKAIRPHDFILSRYLTYWLMAQATRVLRLTTEATHGTKRLDLADLFELPIALPPKSEQERIVTLIDTQRGRIQAEEAYRDKLKLQKQGLMHDLLTGRVRV